MSLENVREQCERILQASVDLANGYIMMLNNLVLKERSTIDNLAAALEQISKEKLEVQIRIVEAEMEILRLQKHLYKGEQSLTTAGDQECPETVAMGRQRGYMGHSDRCPGNRGFTKVIFQTGVERNRTP